MLDDDAVLQETFYIIHLKYELIVVIQTFTSL